MALTGRSPPELLISWPSPAGSWLFQLARHLLRLLSTSSDTLPDYHSPLGPRDLVALHFSSAYTGLCTINPGDALLVGSRILVPHGPLRPAETGAPLAGWIHILPTFWTDARDAVLFVGGARSICVPLP